ncbi:MAG: hypothetical protein E7576_17515 [Ruminococcaceae bacterium]|nr:hypothetical protein [Oscillospiraceae bacterium]
MKTLSPEARKSPLPKLCATCLYIEKTDEKLLKNHKSTRSAFTAPTHFFQGSDNRNRNRNLLFPFPFPNTMLKIAKKKQIASKKFRKSNKTRENKLRTVGAAEVDPGENGTLPIGIRTGRKTAGRGRSSRGIQVSQVCGVHA